MQGTLFEEADFLGELSHSVNMFCMIKYIVREAIIFYACFCSILLANVKI